MNGSPISNSQTAGAGTTVSDPEQHDLVSVPVVFVGVDELPILYANQFVVQLEGNDFILSAGQLTPPILLGSEDEQREQAKDITYVPVRIVARIAMNRERALQLATPLGTQLQRYDERQEGQRP